MKDNYTLKIDLSSIPTDDRYAQIPGKLFLIDNLNEPVTMKDRPEMQKPAQVGMVVLLICKSGRMNVMIDQKNYVVRGGSTMTLLPGMVFQFLDAGENTECAMIALDKDFMNFTSDIKLGIEFAMKIHEHPVFYIDYPSMEETIGIYKALKHKLYKSDFNYKEEIARSYLNILKCNGFDALSHEMQLSKGEPRSSRKEEIFSQFLKVVSQYYKQERNVIFYADKLHVTPKYLSSVIHEVSGRYASEWIMNHVIMQAKNMLKLENRSVKEVCNALNFPNQSFFSKYFKQHTGYTPKEFKYI